MRFLGRSFRLVLWQDYLYLHAFKLSFKLFKISAAMIVIYLNTLNLTHLNDLLLNINGVGDGAAIWPGLCVLPGLATTSQRQNLLQIEK